MFDTRRINAGKASGVQTSQHVHVRTHNLYAADGSVPHPLQTAGAVGHFNTHIPDTFHLPGMGNAMTSVAQGPTLAINPSHVKK